MTRHATTRPSSLPGVRTLCEPNCLRPTKPRSRNASADDADNRSRRRLLDYIERDKSIGTAPQATPNEAQPNQSQRASGNASPTRAPSKSVQEGPARAMDTATRHLTRPDLQPRDAHQGRYVENIAGDRRVSPSRAPQTTSRAVCSLHNAKHRLPDLFILLHYTVKIAL